jgi:hypothetical protein
MRILQVCPYDWTTPGGVQRHVAGLSRALADLNHQVRIVPPRPRAVRAQYVTRGHVARVEPLRGEVVAIGSVFARVSKRSMPRPNIGPDHIQRVGTRRPSALDLMKAKFLARRVTA